ncbi:hypothetical protein H6P81_004693 [Aristolochia fimbriata]|uniref:Uncharacterized protein n=1 Tax=Aristolochia fimbriata TaxID=158543 RepID=A0AAV7ETB2_ARIFI|nr:hypothetical protein H6P81_004693 [Aristolochia fimbriata]
MDEERSLLADFVQHKDKTVTIDNIKENHFEMIEDDTTSKPGPKKRGRKPKSGKTNDNPEMKEGKATEVAVQEKDLTMADFALERGEPHSTIYGHEMEHIRVIDAVSAKETSTKKRGRKPKTRGLFNASGELVAVEDKDSTMVDFALERSPIATVSIGHSEEHIREVDVTTRKANPKKRGRKPKSREINNDSGELVAVEERDLTVADSALEEKGVPIATVSIGHSMEHMRELDATTEKPNPKKRGRKPKARGIYSNNGGLESQEVHREDMILSMVDSASNAGKFDTRFSFDGSDQNRINGIKAGNGEKPLPKKRGRKPKATGMNRGQVKLDNMEVIEAADSKMIDFATNSGREIGWNYTEGNHIREAQVETTAKPGPRKRGRKPKVRGEKNDKIVSQERDMKVLIEEENPRLAYIMPGRQSGAIGFLDNLRENSCIDNETTTTTKPGPKKRGRKPKVREMNNTGGSMGLIVQENNSCLADFISNRSKDGVSVSMFDYAVESHFGALRRISFLCKMVEEDFMEASVDKHLSAAVTFLEHWKDFCYKPKTVRFCYETEGALRKHYIDGVTLPQFSSACVPEMMTQSCSSSSLTSSNDFILHVGGPVWALDWCPRAQVVDHHIKCEYLAVAAHPPDSSYHKMGEPLTGRGLIQIWCVLIVDKEEVSLSENPRNGRKRPMRSGNLDVLQHKHTLAEDLSRLSAVNCLKEDTILDLKENNHAATQSNTAKEHSHDPKQLNGSPVQDEITAIDYSVPADVSLPRLVLGLAHNGRVTWDAKWRPQNVEDSKDKNRMGYLAVLLGNGALEVWEVPFPNVVKTLYVSHQKEGTDPRFIKLQPVFKCSKINRGGHQSIPLTVEWSSSAPYTLLLAGFHDGTVALWKFIASATVASQDTRPLLCFTADNVPIRAVAWGPAERNEESANLIVTGGHEGLRFWDLRDPYRPVWDLNPIRRVVLSIDWLQDPGCLLLAFDDGTLRILSMCQAANDTPVSGKFCRGSNQQGLHFYCYSTFPIWNLHISRLTGVVAYCVADGSALCFQLPRKAVEKDPARHRAQVFQCGSITEEDSILTINTPLSGTAVAMRKPSSGSKETPRITQAKITDPQSADALDSEPVVTPKSHVASKGKKLSSQVPVGTTSEGETPLKSNISGKGVEKPMAEFETFPSKNVPMHRIRWNVNKGSEKWLCYGGAAGIVRCQQLSLTAAPRK